MSDQAWTPTPRETEVVDRFGRVWPVVLDAGALERLRDLDGLDIGALTNPFELTGEQIFTIFHRAVEPLAEERGINQWNLAAGVNAPGILAQGATAVFDAICAAFPWRWPKLEIMVEFRRRLRASIREENPDFTTEQVEDSVLERMDEIGRASCRERV